MANIGYACSKERDELEEQIEILKENGCENIIIEDGYIVSNSRGKFDDLSSYLNDYDVLMVTNLYILFKSLSECRDWLEYFHHHKITLYCTNEIDINSFSDKECFIPIIETIINVDKFNKKERIYFYLKEAKKIGKKIGRHKGMTQRSLEKYNIILDLQSEGFSKTEIARKLNTCRTQINKIIKECSSENI